MKLPVKLQGEAIFTEGKLARTLGALVLPAFECRQRRWRVLTGGSMNLSSELSHHEPKKRIRPISIYSVFAFGFVSLMAQFSRDERDRIRAAWPSKRAVLTVLDVATAKYKTAPQPLGKTSKGKFLEPHFRMASEIFLSSSRGKMLECEWICQCVPNGSRILGRIFHEFLFVWALFFAASKREFDVLRRVLWLGLNRVDTDKVNKRSFGPRPPGCPPCLGQGEAPTGRSASIPGSSLVSHAEPRLFL